MSQTMIDRIIATHESPPGYYWIDIPTDIGWVPCMCCSLPFRLGGKLLVDNQTNKGTCENCGKWGLDKIQGKLKPEEEDIDLPF